MRIRKVDGAEEAIRKSPYCVTEPTERKGKWHAFLNNGSPIHIEVGMGKGLFLTRLAALHPEVEYIGIERYASVLYRALQKTEETPLPNIHFLCVDAAMLPDIFGAGEVERIYLNFSDPWPKERNAKRRLTGRPFLERYESILSRDGRIEFKTDNRELFDFSLAELEAAPRWERIASTEDLHSDPVLNAGNIMTEYEEKFSALGKPIYKLIIQRRKG